MSSKKKDENIKELKELNELIQSLKKEISLKDIEIKEKDELIFEVNRREKIRNEDRKIEDKKPYMKNREHQRVSPKDQTQEYHKKPFFTSKKQEYERMKAIYEVSDPYTLETLPSEDEMKKFKDKKDFSDCQSKIKNLRDKYRKTGELEDKSKYDIVNSRLTTFFEVKNGRGDLYPDSKFTKNE
jgi:selenocysteine-specific translation elongation factor